MLMEYFKLLMVGSDQSTHNGRLIPDHPRLFLKAAGGSAAVIAVVLLVVILGPIRAVLLQQDRAYIETQAALITAEVDAYVELSIRIAAQIPTRTRIREELAALSEGAIEVEDYRAFAGPKLADAVDADPGIIGVVRVSPEGVPVARAGVSVEVPDLAVFDPEEPVLLPCAVCPDRGVAYVVVAPIITDRLGVVGYDVVALSLDELKRRLVHFAATIPETRIVLRAADATVVTAGGRPDRPNDVAVSTELRDQWTVVVSQPDAVLHRTTRRTIGFLVLGVGLVAILFFVMIRGFLRSADRQTTAAMEHLSSVVAARTRDLEAAVSARDLLLQEVHHRIKNDLAMVTSLLSLHRADVAAPEAHEALGEAEHRLRLVSGIYDVLYRAQNLEAVPLRPITSRLLSRFSAAAISSEIADITIERRLAVPTCIVINELVTNAIKYSRPDTAKVVVDVSVTADEHGTLTVVVTDNGPGIPPTVIDDEPGFGLTMVRLFAEQFTGSVEIPETDGGGEIRVTLRSRP